MRILICITALFICLATLPSVQSQKRNKLAEYDERDRRNTKERYTKREENEDERSYKKLKYKGRNNDDEEITGKKFKKYKNDENERQYKKPVRRFAEEDDEVPKGKKYNKYNKRNEDEEIVIKNKFRSKKIQESDEDDDTDEDNDSEVCINGKGNCDSLEDDDTDEDETDEDESDEVPVKKRVIYIKKFAHEKEKNKKLKDKEIGSIMKIHKKSGVDISKSRRYDDDSSEEVTLPKRHRFTYEDEE